MLWSSSPVEKKPTLTFLKTVTLWIPSAARKFISGAWSRVPFVMQTSPLLISSPFRRTLSPALTSDGKVISLSSAFTISCLTTVSAPSGTSPPVIIRTHSPDWSFFGQGWPAKEDPTSFNVKPSGLMSSEPKAQPSIAELLKSGRSMGEWRSSANTNPSASEIAFSAVEATGSI